MKKAFWVATAAVFLSATQAHSALRLYDGFDYTADADLHTQTNGAYGQTWTFAGTPATAAGPDVGSLGSNLAYPGLAASSGLSAEVGPATNGNTRINIPGTPVTGGPGGQSLYYSYVMSLQAIAVGAANGVSG